MTNLALPRNPATGELQLPGLRATLSTDFLLDTALPSWLTVLTGTGYLSPIGSGQGDLLLVTAATANAKARLQGPAVDLSKVEAVLWELDGLGSSSTAATVALALGVAGAANVGGQAAWTAASTTGTATVPGASSGITVPHNAVGGTAVEAGRRRNLAVLILPKRKHLYVMLGDQVIVDADLPAMTTGQATPFVELTTTTATAVALLVSRARLTVWKSTARVPVGTGSALPPAAPSAMSLTATPTGANTIVINRSGGDGANVTYALYRGTTPTGSPIATSFPFTDTGLTAGTPVSYVATATNATGTATSQVVSATPTAGVPAGTVLVQDPFTAADGTTLAGRTAPGGSTTPTWAVEGTGAMGIVSNQVKATSGNGTQFAVLDTGVTQSKVKATVKALLSDATRRRAGLMIGYVDTSNYVRVVSHTAGTYVVAKVIGGTVTTLISSTKTATVNDVVELGRTITNGVATYSLVINGAAAETATDSDLLAATKAGIYGQWNNTSGSTAQDQVSAWDDFTVTSV